MGLAEAINELKATRPRNFKDWRLTADAETLELIDSAIYDVTITPNALAATLAANGIPITRETILKMRHDAR